jgi:hypothetical protein
MIGSSDRIDFMRGRQSKLCFEQSPNSVVANALRLGGALRNVFRIISRFDNAEFHHRGTDIPEKQKTPQHNVAAFQFAMTQRD